MGSLTESVYLSSPAGARTRRFRFSLFDAIIFSFAGLVNTASYFSPAPLLVAAFFFAPILLTLLITPLGGRPEVRMFIRVFGVGFLVAGVAAVYANQLGDPLQLSGDAGGFFEMAVDSAGGLSLAEVRMVHEGALAIALWREAYDFFHAIGFEKYRYIGVTINVATVALSGVIGIKMVRCAFGNDDYRFRQLTLLASSCGLLWLFAGVHLRDSFVLLVVTALAYMWVRFLAKAELGWKLLWMLIFSGAATALVGFLRTSFVFVPGAMFFAAMGALAMSHSEDHRGRRVAIGVSAVGAAIGFWLLSAYGEVILLALELYSQNHSDLGAEANSGGLGYRLIVDQVLPIKITLGSIYLFVFPIPFWVGFQLESVYSLYKSFNVVFFYFFLPLLFLTLRQIAIQKNARSALILFLLFISGGFTLAVAGTSLETRHFGAFLIPLFVLATLPDLRIRKTKAFYFNYFKVTLTVIGVVHAAWIILKA